jgi:hypothetical protein
VQGSFSQTALMIAHSDSVSAMSGFGIAILFTEREYLYNCKYCQQQSLQM